MPVIYIDVLLILNLWVDFLLLTATARLRRIPKNRWRLTCGAVLGAVGSAVLFLPILSTPWAVVVRIVGTVILVLVGFPFGGWRAFFKILLTFSILGGVFSGLCTALWYTVAPAGFIVENGVAYIDAPASLLIVFTAISYVAVCVFEYAIRRRAPQNRTYRLTLTHNGKTLVCRCLYDSGSTLREPFSGAPCVLIDCTAAGDMLKDIQTATRVVPFKSLGGEGLLQAFLPNSMQLSDGEQVWDISGSYAALCDTLADGEYTALVGTDIGDYIERGGNLCKV